MVFGTSASGALWPDPAMCIALGDGVESAWSRPRGSVSRATRQTLRPPSRAHCACWSF